LTTKHLSILCDIATEAHTRIQQEFKEINPIVGVNQSMRKSGVPADVMTIECLRTDKRIVIVLHDQQQDIINYQFCFRNKDPEDKYEQIQFTELTTQKLFDWMKDYFQTK